MEKRRFKRDKFVTHAQLSNNKDRYPCATLNISESGLGILSDTVLRLGDYTLIIDDYKFRGKLLYCIDKGRGKAVVDKQIYQYGILLNPPLSSDMKNKLVVMKSKV